PPPSLNEALLEPGGTERLHHDPPARTLAKFARRSEREIGITVSVGLSYCKFLAKVAADAEGAARLCSRFRTAENGCRP
ncbi:hypothetical protein ACC731_38380, partial [Rhizobium ruizarguesonis]